MNNELYHYGVIGMKWGVRRSDAQLGRASNRKKKRSKPDVKKMSDEDLKNAVGRLNMEKQYKSLTANDTKKGKEYVDKTLKTAATIAGVTTTFLTLYNNSKKIRDIFAKSKFNDVGSVFNDKVDRAIAKRMGLL